MIYEFCAENFTHVPAAIEAGARRIELCDNLAVGGTTPSTGVIAQTVEYAHAHGARVMCMVRPRGGDFVCLEDELQMMEADLDVAIGLKVDGIVFGCLAPRDATAYGESRAAAVSAHALPGEGPAAYRGGYRLDKPAIERVLDAAFTAATEAGTEPLDVTFHMAFDALDPADQLDAIDYLAERGVTRILTHGGAAGTAIEDNLARLADLRAYAADRLIVLPGAGISYANRDEVAAALGCPELHGTKIVKLG